ncbi:hypothetical protein [Azospirillum sp. ST 5-10]|uniref:hypothetical protein n=1 Tax=unclassified Azospirillum TaxID=2630922 RepID=UPI003F4A2CE3
MTSTPSTLAKTERMAAGENDDAWGEKANAVFDRHEEMIAGMATVDVSADDVTLSDDEFIQNEARQAILKCTGMTPTARIVTIPARTKRYLVSNDTTGGFALILTTGSGLAASVPNGQARDVWCDGTNVRLVDDGASGATIGLVLALTMSR